MKNNVPAFVFSTKTNESMSSYTSRSDGMLSLPVDEFIRGENVGVLRLIRSRG